MNARERLSSLLSDADAAANGGVAAVATRLLQHRQLLQALHECVEGDRQLEAACAELMECVKLYPVYSQDYREGANPITHRWGLRSMHHANRFHAVIEKIIPLIHRDTADFTAKEPTP